MQNYKQFQHTMNVPSTTTQKPCSNPTHLKKEVDVKTYGLPPKYTSLPKALGRPSKLTSKFIGQFAVLKSLDL